MPGVVEGAGVGVVELAGVDVDVAVGRGVHEVARRERWRALVLAPGVPSRPGLGVDAVELRQEVRPLRAIGHRVAGEHRRDVVAAHLERVAGDDPDERRVACHQCGERDDVVLDDHVGPVLGDDLPQPRLGVPRSLDQRGVRRLDEARELVAGRLGELRCRLVDEVDPELTGRPLLRVGVWLGEVDERLHEAVRREPAGPRRLGREHHPVPPVEQHLAEADALVGGPVGRLRHEHHGQRFAHAGHAIAVPSVEVVETTEPTGPHGLDRLDRRGSP